MAPAETTRQVLRAMAWQRAKGELRSMLETINPRDESQEYDELDTHIKAFEAWIEYHGMHQ